MRTRGGRVGCARYGTTLTRVCERWPVGEVRERECRACGQPHHVARCGDGEVYASAEFYSPLQPQLPGMG